MRNAVEKEGAGEMPTQPNSGWHDQMITVSIDGPSVVPPSLIAGRVPIVRGARPDEAAYNTASLALDSEQIALISSVENGFVYYLACLAADLASAPRGSTCLLAAALPGLPGHRGQGVYSVDQGGLVACLMLDPRGLRSFIGEPEVAADLHEAEGAAGGPTYRVDVGDTGPRLPAWVAYGEMQRASVRRYSAYSAYTLSALTFLGCLVWAYGIFMNAEKDERFRAFKAEVVRLMAARPAQLDDGSLATANQAWRDFAQLSAFCLKQDGKILMFKSDGRRQSWRLEISSASDEQINAGLEGLGHEIISRADKWIVQSKDSR